MVWRYQRRVWRHQDLVSLLNCDIYQIGTSLTEKMLNRFSQQQPSGEWSPARVVASAPDLAHWNPVLFYPPSSNTLHLFYKVGTPIPFWRTTWISSQDHGETWSSPVQLVDGDNTGGRGPVKNPLLVLENGDWVAGASKEVTLEIDEAGKEKGVWDCFADVAPAGHDQGLVWLRSLAVPLPADRDTPGSSFQGPGIIQPTLWQTPSDVTGTNAPPGSVHMLTRSSSGYVMRSDSTDNGRTWSPAYPTVLPNNNSGLCLAYLPPHRFASLSSDDFISARSNGRVYIAHNPNSGNWGARTPLVISISDDQGETWKTWKTLEDLKPPDGYKGIVAKETGIVSDGTAEFSYPTVVPTAEGDAVGVWCSYTWQRKGIVVAKVIQ